MTTLYSKCYNLSPDFFPELLLSSIFESQDWETQEDTNTNLLPDSWLETIILFGKTACGTGAVTVFAFYLAIPKPHLTAPFATLSIRSTTTTAQLQLDIEKQKEGSPLEDTRQQSTIGTALQSEASGSGILESNQKEARRTTSSAVSISPRESGLPFLKSGNSEINSTLVEEPQFSNLEKIEEKETIMDPPPIQQMNLGSTGISSANAAQRIGRTETARQRQTVRGNKESARSQALRTSSMQGGSAEFGGFNQPDPETPKRRCSPCSDSILSCCTSVTKNYRTHVKSLYQSGPASSSRAQRLAPSRGASTNQASTEGSIYPWDYRSTNDLVKDYFNLPTEEDRERYYTACTEGMVNPDKANRFLYSIEVQEKEIEKQAEFQRKRENLAAIARVSQIEPILKKHNAYLDKDTCSVKGFPEGSSRDYLDSNYQENVPWELRIRLNDATGLKAVALPDYLNMRAHSGAITKDTYASQQREFQECLDSSKEAQEAGRKKVLEIAIKSDHLRILPIAF